jgi:hypothetical protein
MRIIGSGKYGKAGLYTKESFRQQNLSEKSKSFLADTANFALAKSTWSTYKTTRNHLIKCQQQTGEDMSLPTDTSKATFFLSWLLEDRQIKPASVESYLSGLRQLHLVEGFEAPKIRTDIINTILKGAKHRSWLEEKINPKSKRLPMDLVAINLLGMELNKQAMEKSDIRLIWAVSLVAFFGSFRMGELLTDHEEEFDPTLNLLTEDIVISKDSNSCKLLQLKLKLPKENRTGKPVIVDLFENNSFCPIKAIESWILSSPPREKGMPAFRLKSGAALTKKHFNAILKRCLNKNLPAGMGFFSGHSFRAGIPSMLGGLGYSSEDIMCVGRWSSNSYECYVKTARTKRQRMAREISSMI